VLHSILPEELCDGSPSAFTITGHLAHYNLRDEYLPYKHIIGEVTLDKNPALRTVVNKLDAIDTQFRFFKMELLAGEPDYIVEAHESDCRFIFDFSNVYWNSRLHTEHERLVALFQPEQVIADVFAGVGPFAIPAAKKRCIVYANDLNPSSTEYLEKNVKGNSVERNVRVTTLDGREFIRHVVEDAWNHPLPTPPPHKSARQRAKETRHNRQQGKALQEMPMPVAANRRIDHFVMNLPDTALLFLDSFRGLFSNLPREAFREVYNVMPMVHCHCFTREREPIEAEKDIRQRGQDALGCPLPSDTIFHLVRTVAPNKDMYCVSFRLPVEVGVTNIT